MNAAELRNFEDAGMREWRGDPTGLAALAHEAHLRHAAVDLSRARDRATLFSELDRALALLPHFGHNFDALADVLEDRDWLGKAGIVIVLLHAAAWRREHPSEWNTLEDVLTEAADYWRERHLPFWIFTA
jgi:RNAse (barnase) inhibitor barstar